MGDDADPDVVFQLLRRLIEGHEYHNKPDFVRSVIWCVQELFDKGNDEVVEKTATLFVQFYDKSIPLLQNQLQHGIYMQDKPLLPLLLSNRSLLQNSTFPRHILLDTYFPSEDLTTRLLEPYVMCKGVNSSFNLGVASDGEVKEPRVVPIKEKILKVSMSNSHTLFLSASGAVYGCGKGTNGQLGPELRKLVVEPVHIKLPGPSNLRVVDMVACEKYSVFVTAKSVFVCGDVPHSEIGSTADVTIRRFDLVHGDSAPIVAVCASPERIVVSTSDEDWIIGTSFRSHTKHTVFCVDNSCRTLALRERACLFQYGLGKMRATPQICFGTPSTISSLSHSGVQVAAKTERWRTVRLPWRGGDPSVVEVLLRLSTSEREEMCVTQSSVGFMRAIFNCPSVPDSECLFSINGSLVRMNVVQFEVTEDGHIVLLGFTLLSDDFVDTNASSVSFPAVHNMPKTNSAGMSLYKGKVVLASDSLEDGEFTLCAGSHDKLFYRLNVVLELEEIPGTHSVRQFAMSPDGKNIIYLVDSDEISVQRLPFTARKASHQTSVNTKFHRQWSVLDIDLLNEMRGGHGLDPIICDLSVSPGLIGDNDEVMLLSLLAKTRFPQLEKYMENGELSSKLLKAAIGDDYIVSLVANYISGRDTFHPKRVFESKTRSLSKSYDKIVADLQAYKNKFFLETKHRLNALGLDFIDEAYDLWRIRSLQGTNFLASLAKDIEIKASDGVIHPFNTTILSLHSHYFVVALNRMEEGKALKMDFPSRIVEYALRVLLDPAHLYDVDYGQLFTLLELFDQYLCDAALEDCVAVLFDRATEFNVTQLFECYRHFEHLQPFMDELFLQRLHLLCFWRSSSSAPLHLLREMASRMKHQFAVKEGALNGFGGGGGLIDTSLRMYPGWCAWSNVAKEDVMRIVLGECREEAAVKHFEALYKKAQPNHLEVCEEELFSPPHHLDEVKDRPSLVTQLMKAKQPRQRRHSENAKEVLSVSLPSPPSTLVEEPVEMLEELKIEEGKGDLADSGISEASPVEEEHNLMIPGPSSVEACSPPIINRWGVATSSSPSAFGDSPLRAVAETPKKHGEKFISKGRKFHRVDMTTTPQKSSIAPWLAASTSTPSPKSLREIQLEEEKTMNSTPKPIPIKPRTRKNTWNEEPTPSPQQQHPMSLAAIMAEEEARNSTVVKAPRPLEHVEIEERAVQELTRLYETEYCESAMVTVEIVESAPTTTRWGSGYRR